MRKMSNFAIEEITEESFSTLDESIERPSLAFDKEEFFDILGKFKYIFEEDCNIRKNKEYKNDKFSSFLFEDEEEEEMKVNIPAFDKDEFLELDFNDNSDLKDFRAFKKIFKIKSKNNDRIYQKFKVEIFEEEEENENENGKDYSNYLFNNSKTQELTKIEGNLVDDNYNNSFASINLALGNKDIEFEKDFLKENLEVDNFQAVPSSFNYNGNYQNYLGRIMESIPVLLMQDYSNLINQRKVNLSDIEISKNKKTLILDLDETLVHSDFDENYKNHDKEITFILNNEEFKVNIILRPKVKEFLKKVNELFEVIVFTAGIKEYADAVLNYLDPENKIFKHRFYRDSCICVNDCIHIKDLRIFSNRKLQNLVIVDNSFYSFVNQPDNGILINSFYQNDKDNELINLFNYLNNYILNAEDVRCSNESIFNFKSMSEKSRRNESLRRY